MTEPANPEPDQLQAADLGAAQTPHSDDLRRAPSLAHALNPFHLLFGPIFQRDVRTTGRRKSTYITRAGYTFALLVIAGVALPGIWFELRESSGAAQLQSLQSFAPGITVAVLWFQFLLIVMAAPASTAPCICDERNKRTLPALLTTPLRPSHIIFGHLASRSVNLLILAAIVAPVLLGLRVFGGVRADLVLYAITLTLVTALLGAAIGLLASIDARRASAASTQAHTVLALFAFGPMILVYFLSQLTFVQLPPWAEGVAFLINPFFIMGLFSAELISGGAGGIGAGLPLATHEILLIHVAIQLTLTLLMAFAGIARLRKRLNAVAAGVTPKRWARAEHARAKRLRKKQRKAPAPTQAESQDEDAATLERRDAREVSDHPVLWRELRQPAIRGGAMRIITYIAVPLALIWYGFFADVDAELRVILPAMIAMVVFLFIGANAASSAFTGEREGRTWEELLTTRLRAHEIILPKIIGALRGQWAVLAFCILFVGGIGVLRSGMHPLGAVCFTVVIASSLVFLAAVGAAGSLVCKRPGTASVIAIGVPAVLWIGAPLFFGFFLSLFRFDFDRLGTIAFAAHPFTMAGASLEGALDDSVRRGPYDIANENLHAPGFALVVAAYAAVYLTAAALLILAMLKGFNRFAPRVS